MKIDWLKSFKAGIAVNIEARAVVTGDDEEVDYFGSCEEFDESWPIDQFIDEDEDEDE
tara:strand:+ start:199 stop:372 length:174 start_codon:yes stop_codon:yes gene_type:complete